MVHAVEERWGPVSLLVNNAGVAGQALFQDVSDEMWHRYFSTNVDGAYHTIQAVLPAMLHAHEGCIINISSIWGQRGASCEVTYSCTKAALIGLTRSLASELAPTHIRVNWRDPHRHAGRAAAGGAAPAGGGNAHAPPRHPGGYRPRGGISGLGQGGFYHRAGADGGRRVHPLRHTGRSDLPIGQAEIWESIQSFPAGQGRN